MRRFRNCCFLWESPMPIYEYRCDNCGHEFETIQKVSEPQLITCPACETDALRKKISAAGFRLKGGGWYETDFKSDKKRNVAAEDRAAGDGAKADGGGKSEAGGSDKSGDGASKTAGDSSKSTSESKSSSSAGKAAE